MVLSFHLWNFTGLRAEDLLMDEQPDVAEAIKRLPQEEQDLRMFRLKISYDLTMKQIILPEDQWTKPEEVPPKLFRLWFNCFYPWFNFKTKPRIRNIISCDTF